MAAAPFRDGLNERGAIVQPVARRAHAAVLVRRGRQVGPTPRPRGRRRGRMDPRLDARDQIELPGAAMELPAGERGESGHQQDRGEVEGDQRREPLARQGFCSASCGDIGIMF